MRKGTLSILVRVLGGGAFGLAAALCAACGYEDPQSVSMGALNFAYPDALHVGTAIWQAEVDGVLRRETPPAPTLLLRSFATPISSIGSEARAEMANNVTNVNACTSACTAALVEALSLLEQVRERLATDSQRGERPALALVFASRMLWTRFVPEANTVTATPHVSGPERGEVVVITEAAVLRALLAGSLTADVLFSRNLVRLYGDASAVDSTRQWLATMAPTQQKAVER